MRTGVEDINQNTPDCIGREVVDGFIIGDVPPGTLVGVEV